ncbi:Sensitive to high expression protein 9, mitochondrial [Vanrija pseudolonga]|uniref:Sensitive to high expression protein 9, mitochondrial n=1 Tax=Vanrija pseudolonga TaxID=143232 RepID=A0AAF0YDH9_9TREE|nr:Sensitive to high expression protein 9, mitochondrial [Vanrija pseudolonga]
MALLVRHRSLLLGPRNLVTRCGLARQYSTLPTPPPPHSFPSSSSSDADPAKAPESPSLPSDPSPSPSPSELPLLSDVAIPLGDGSEPVTAASRPSTLDLSPDPSPNPSPNPSPDSSPDPSPPDNGTTTTPTGGSSSALDRLDPNGEYQARINEWKESLDKKSRELADNAYKGLTFLGLKVNEATGYREVELLKQAVKDREHDLSSRRQEARVAKKDYEEAVSTRATSQQSVNALLERKHSWSDSDVANFTSLVRSDHASRHAVTTTSEQLKKSEIDVDKAFTSLMQSILERYHEEQVWSDKIRSVSTWAGLIALAANLIVFVGAIAFVEPWKRRRLVGGLEERMSGMMSRVESEISHLSAAVAKLDPAATTGATAAAVATVSPTTESEVVAEAPQAAASQQTEESEVKPSPTPSEATTLSPIEQLSAAAPSSSKQSELLSWIVAQLGRISPPTVERDLGAAGVAGAVAGATVVGLVSIAVSAFRSR